MWFKLRPEVLRTVEMQALGMASLGLMWWMIERSWEQGGLPDDPETFRLALSNRCDSGTFRGAWSQVRPLWDQDADGKLRLAWLEEAREDTFKRTRNDAIRQSLHRSRRHVTRDSRGRHADVTQKSRARRDGTGQDKTGEENQKAPAAPGGGSQPWEQVIEQRKLDPLTWGSACREWQEARQSNRHKALGVVGWSRLLAEWQDRGAAAFLAAVRHSASQGYQGVFGERASIPTNGKPTLQSMLRGVTL